MKTLILAAAALVLLVTTAHAEVNAYNMAHATGYNDACEIARAICFLHINGITPDYMARVSVRRGYFTLQDYLAQAAKVRSEWSMGMDAWCAANADQAKRFLIDHFSVSPR